MFYDEHILHLKCYTHIWGREGGRKSENLSILVPEFRHLSDYFRSVYFLEVECLEMELLYLKVLGVYCKVNPQNGYTSLHFWLPANEYQLVLTFSNAG